MSTPPKDDLFAPKKCTAIFEEIVPGEIELNQILSEEESLVQPGKKTVFYQTEVEKPFVGIYAPTCLKPNKLRHDLFEKLLQKIESYQLDLGETPIRYTTRNDFEYNERTIEHAIQNANSQNEGYVTFPEELWNVCSQEQQQGLIQTIKEYHAEVAKPHHDMRKRIKNFLNDVAKLCPEAKVEPHKVSGGAFKYQKNALTDIVYPKEMFAESTAADAADTTKALVDRIHALVGTAVAEADKSQQETLNKGLSFANKSSGLRVSFSQELLDYIVTQTPEKAGELLNILTQPAQEKLRENSSPQFGVVAPAVNNGTLNQPNRHHGHGMGA